MSENNKKMCYLYTLNVTEEGGATRKVAPES